MAYEYIVIYSLQKFIATFLSIACGPVVYVSQNAFSARCAYLMQAFQVPSKDGYKVKAIESQKPTAYKPLNLGLARDAALHPPQVKCSLDSC